MAYVGGSHPAVGRLLMRLLPCHPLESQTWTERLLGPVSPRRGLIQQTRRQPVVVLLGPVGSGKTTALRSIEEGCGTGVVHAYYDFDANPDASTVEVLTSLAYKLSQKWTVRRPVRFIRFTLGLIAAQAPLTSSNRDANRADLARRIDDFARNPRAAQVVDAVERLADAAEAFADSQPGNRVPSVFWELLKKVMPRLVTTITRRPLRTAKRWHVTFPAANAVDPLDALLNLNQLSRENPAEVTAWLVEAFLADIRANHLRLSKADPYSPCECLDTEHARHRHGWVLLLDNIDTVAGSRFVGDLVAAREEHLKSATHDRHDPLLVLASSGRWKSDWESRWLAPWKAAPAGSTGVRTVPPVSKAHYANWDNDDTRPVSWYYPVLLEPLGAEETADILNVDPDAPLCEFALRAAGGLPGPIRLLANHIERDAGPGRRDALVSGRNVTAEILDNLHLTDHLTGIDLQQFIDAAPFATAPWLVPHDAASVISQPQVGGILTELRTALWINGPQGEGPTADYARIQPWIGRLLIAALRHRDDSTAVSYTTQFTDLLADSRGNPEREAYCRLALGEVVEVVEQLLADFHQLPHYDWVRRVRFVTSAPDPLPIERTSVELYEEQIALFTTSQSTDPLRHTVARLVVASWLTADPFAIPAPKLRRIVGTSYLDLAPRSARSDVAALYEAAEEMTSPAAGRGRSLAAIGAEHAAARRAAPRVRPFSQPKRWPGRHPRLATGLALLLLGGLLSGTLAAVRPWERCGPGMTSVGAPYHCVGLNLESTPFQADDPLRDLEHQIATDNDKVRGAYVTVVLLENLTPDAATDSAGVESAKHDIEGALTAVRRANGGLGIGVMTDMKFRLLLANGGSAAGDSHWPEAVAQIKRHARQEHIVAVTGIGVSLDETRTSVAALGADGDASLAIVGSLTTGDNMNRSTNGRPLQNFFRVAPTNSDEARAAYSFITRSRFQNILLINDTNPREEYAGTLAAAFRNLTKIPEEDVKSYTSPSGRLVGTTRKNIVANQFSRWTTNICSRKPDLIYFAGRGVDLAAFLEVMNTTHCGEATTTILTGDDASNLVGRPLPWPDIARRVIYTALAAPDEWKGRPCYTSESRFYGDFYGPFTGSYGFPRDDLDDGNAIMNYDAMMAAIQAARTDMATRTNPSLVAGYLHGFVSDDPLHGATGDIAFDGSGNRINAPMPLMQIRRDGSQRQEDIAWPRYEPHGRCP